MTLQRFFSILFLVPFLVAAAPVDTGFWRDGKDFPNERVNVGIKFVTPDAYVKVSEKADSAVVNINTTQNAKPTKRFHRKGFSDPGPEQGPGPNSPFDDFFDDFFKSPFGNPEQQQVPRKSLGSGFVLNEDGYIVTNNHVVADADEIKVTLSDESQYDAKIVGRDTRTDVALLKINTKKKLTHVVLGDSAQLKVGDIVIAIGNPFGLSHSVTQGIVSAKERAIGFGPYDDFIQTDASINPGNSGGPLLNLYGEVVGINAAIVASGQGIGFAIPINLAKDILNKLKAGGKVTRGYLGIGPQKIDDEMARALNLNAKEGALVSEIVKKSPAERAGFKVGDVIVSYDGRRIKDFTEIYSAVGNTPIGKRVKVEIIRDGQTKALDVEIGELKEDQAPEEDRSEKTADLLGLSVRELNEGLSRELGIDKEVNGVLVVSVDPSSQAASRGVRRGDVILEVDRKPTRSVSDYRSVVEGKKKGESVLLLIKRGKAMTLYIAFTL